ncbi:YciI family protein [Pelomonas sp. SE-A7]|uniref:YciI family protein n=1 Tax=Pelomonas sp. SE-A7 TaxID=3054953 RepID=UPI00259CE01C|nr:YciI family protein [Pelomonas sp. SE-A7]MDM4764753.1 YciI family protein [Pelomonas sp. SE-A7]
MFLVDLTFVKPLELVDLQVQAHREYLQGFYERGDLLLGGRKQPRTGGIILSRQATLEDVKAVFDADPMVAGGLAEYAVTEFLPVMKAKALENLV